MTSTHQPEPPPTPSGLRPDASVLALVPFSGCERWLEHCLASLAAQTRPLSGIVVIDDCSATPPSDIVSRFPTATLLTAAGNVGPYRLIQQVIDDTDADGYLFQDADDWSAPDRLERLLLASSRTGAELVGSDYVMLTSDEASIVHHAFPLHVNPTLAGSPTTHAMQHSTSLVTRRLVTTLGGYPSGMRFGGDDEFLRRAAHTTLVVNVPRPLYFRRHRADSLAASALPGHGTVAQRQVVSALAARARQNASAAATGGAPDVRPFSTAGAIALRHICGPRLDALPARPRRQRRARPGVGTNPPLFVLGGPASGADALVWSLGQHPQLLAVGASDWLTPFAEAARAIVAATTPGHVEPDAARHLGPLDVLARSESDLIDALAGAVHQLLLFPRPPQQHDEPDIETTLRAVASAPITTEDRWVASLPADEHMIVAALRLFPRAHVVHLVRDVDEVAAALARTSFPSPARDDAGDGHGSWLRHERIALAAERLAGADRVTRITFTELVESPADVVARCLALTGLRAHPACVAPLRALELTPAPDEGPNGEVQDLARDVSAALGGPPRSPTTLPSLHEMPVPRLFVPIPAAPQRPPGSRRSTDTVDGPLALLRAAIPAGAVVAIVSKGEPAFVEAEDFEGWHFPQDEAGRWAGYHPASTADVIGHLVALHARGARYFFVPAWAVWWVEFYDGLADHLERHGRLVASSDSGGLLYDLGAAALDPGHGTPGVLERPDAAPPVGTLPVVSVGGPGERRAGTNGTAGRTSGGSVHRGRSGRRRSVSVLAWDVTHNPLGRAHLLAEMLTQDYDVELVGGRFSSFGTTVWAPHAATALPLRTFEGGSIPDVLGRMSEMASTITSDAVLVSKPRLPSFGLGILAKLARNRPLVVDVDDLELSFVGADHGLSLEELRTKVDDELFRNPYGRLWTQHCDTLIGDADAVTVSNQVLGDRYGGTVIPHARDERLFDPARYDRERVRTSFGFAPDEHIVLFGGTPRRHKGVLDVARALHEIGDRRLQLCLIGTVELDELRAALEPYRDHVRVVPYQPFDQLPALLCAADMVCVLQDHDSAVSDFQIPAKITDAMAMQLPCLVRPVAPLMSLIGEHLEVFEGDDLASRIRELVADETVRARARANRDLFLERYSYAAVRPVLKAVVEESFDGLRPAPASFRDLVRFERSLLLPPERPSPVAVEPGVPPAAPRVPSPMPGGPVDVVLLWKQNDTGIYGRRHDMLMAELAASPAVHQVIQFDTPTTSAALGVPAGDLPHHAALVRERALARRNGVERTPALHQYTYVADGPAPPRGTPWGDDYLRYVSGALSRHGIGDRPTVLWVYPTNFDYAGIDALVQPDVTVADVVDDNRTWADPDGDHARAITENYTAIVGAADIVVVNCERMRAQMAPLVRGAVHLVPNGCELPSAAGGDEAVPAELAGRGPVVGYVGNLSSRLDLDLLDLMATQRPDWHLVLIGSAHAGRDVMRLVHHPNVSMLGPKPYEEAKRYVRHFDVGIIPHLDNPMTQAMNPLKAFVYASLNVPIVSTAVAGLDELASLITVAADADAFVAAVAAAIERGRAPLSQDARELLAENSWERRAAAILDLVGDQLTIPVGAT